MPPHQATHEVTADAGRGVVVKRYRSWSRGEPAREWAALTLLAEFAPGLAPAPLRAALQADPPGIVMSLVRDTVPGARVTPSDAGALGGRVPGCADPGSGRYVVRGDPEQPVQIIDSRDLARLVGQLLQDGRGGAFHAVGPATPVTLGGLIATCARVAGTDVETVPVPTGLAPPFFPLIRTDWVTQQRSAARARAAGLPATPLEVTVADVLEWDRQRGEPPLGHGFTGEQEHAILAQHDSGAYR